MKLQELVYQIKNKDDITSDIAETFIEHLSKQGKVTIPTVEKVKTCNKIVCCYANKELIGIGALKSYNNIGLQNAGLLRLESVFSWELGYFYVND